MITYLNGKDWRLRFAFLESIVSVAALVGSTSLEEFVLPLMEQALAGECNIPNGRDSSVLNINVCRHGGLGRGPCPDLPLQLDGAGSLHKA
jgi:hypothetical protein